MATSQKTASTHRSAFVRGTHQFDIVGYSTRKTLGARNPVRSGNFEAGGFTWALLCCFDDESLASISLELSRNDTDEAVIAMASLRIDDPTGTGRWPAADWRSDEPNTFPARSTSAIAWKLSVPDAFQEARYVDKDDDRLTIHCTVHVLQEDDSTTGATRNCFVSVPPPPSLSGDIHRLLRGSWWPDVTFVVEQTKIQAHKLVLAMRSPVFGAEFRGDMKERTMRSVRIDDMSVSTFKAMLHFIYTDEKPKPKKGACPAAMARDLLVAADLYDLERLRLMCENMLSESIGVDTAMATLMLVHGRHSCRQLEASCIEYMASDPVVYDAVKETPEYKELKESCSAFITDITDKVATRAVARNSSPSSSSSSSSSRTTKSASRYNPSAVMSGAHEFVIASLSALRKRHGVDQYIRSGSFQVGGYEWAIKVYPSGQGGEDTGHIGLFLALLTDAAAIVNASVTITIDDPTGKSPATNYQFKHVYADGPGESFGWRQFITVASANSRYVGHDGSLTIRCQVAVTTESCATTTTAAAAIAVPPSNMAWHLEQLLASEQGSDVKFLVQGSEIHAHGLVIAARSPVLHEAVESATNTDHVSIDGMKAATFKAMLHFIYTDELPRMGDLVPAAGDATTVAGEMLAAACRFRLERMKRLCENVLAENVTTGNALATLKLAGRHHCPELEEYCIEYIALPHVVKDVMKNFNLFLQSQGD